MHGDLLDLALLVIAVGFAISGYRQGFTVGSLSFVGFVGGAALGAAYGPDISRVLIAGPTQQDVVSFVLLIIFAIVGQFVFSSIGIYVRQSMTSMPSAVLDSVGGAGVSVLSMLLIAWAMGSVLNASPVQSVASQIDNSAVLTTMDKVMPSMAKTWFGQFRHQLASGPFPQVFSGIGSDRLLPISAPDPNVLNSPGYEAARSRVVKIQGFAPGCSLGLEGSGFVFAPDHIMTDAHVVAGVRAGPNDMGTGPAVTTIGGKVYDNAKVVLYDPQVDVAVLYVPGLNLQPLSFDTSAQAGDSAIVAGYPQEMQFTQGSARIGEIINFQGPDIYRTGEVSRDTYEIRALVQEGNSGGPLLSPDGTVYGVTFSTLDGSADTAFALTASEVAGDAAAGARQTIPTSTQGCD